MQRIQLVALALVMVSATMAAAAGPESKRLLRAKDYIADEQWPKAVIELRAAAADPKETRRDEALYWLAHSLNQAGDPAAAVETIGRLEREFPTSMWVKPARSLRIEIAVRLNRSDVLWWTAMPPPPPAPPQPLGPPRRQGNPPPVPLPPPAPGVSVVVPPPPPPPPPQVWGADIFRYSDDPDLRIQALNGLMKTDAERVIPVLGDIVFDSDNVGQAGRALFVLAQSALPQARAMVVQAARTAAEPVRLAAVRELGRFGGPEASKDLLQVYVTANEPVKVQIVKSLGERSERVALLQIAKSEKDGEVRSTAITSLGQAGGAAQLVSIYPVVGAEGRRPIIVALFRARAETELIHIAQTESNEALRTEALERLRLLGTPKAKEYLQKVAEKR